MNADKTVVLPDAHLAGSLRELAAVNGVRFILARFVDLAGKPCAKLVPTEAADEFQAEGVGFAGYAAGLLGQQPSDPDVIAIPDLASFTPLPAVQPGLALVHCDLHGEGERWPYAPRVILAAVLARAAARGLALRSGARTTTSGATWSPRHATYGGNDRTHLIRVPDHHRIELRSGDGSANPYLAIAAVLAAGLDGLDRKLDPGAPGARDGARELPPTLLHAVDALEADAVVSGALDAAGPGVAAYYGKAKREEFLEWHAQVSAWEIDRYLTAF